MTRPAWHIFQHRASGSGRDGRPSTLSATWQARLEGIMKLG